MAIARQVIRQSDTLSSERFFSALVLTEMNHRVANSLQIASGILLLGARRSNCREVQSELNAVATRINAVGLLHRRLCYSTTMEAVNLPGYLQELCAEIGASTIGGNGATFTFAVHGTEPLHVGSDTATHIGLIVTELATNSVKHAQSKPLCEIALFIETDHLRLTVSDDGPGLPAHFCLQESKGIGLQLVQSLVAQLRGKIDISPSEGGASFVITMPKAAATALHF